MNIVLALHSFTEPTGKAERFWNDYKHLQEVEDK